MDPDDVGPISYHTILNEQPEKLIMWFKYLEILFFENNHSFVHFVK